MATFRFGMRSASGHGVEPVEGPRVPSSLVARYIARELLGLAVSGVALFWSAGTAAWPMGWAVFGVLAGWVLATGVVLLAVHPELLASRLGPRPGGKRWDVVLLSVLGLANLVRLVVAGLDRRRGWTPDGAFPLGVMVAAAVMAALGYALFVWAMAANAFFSQQVRLQPERGQVVVTGGPYRFLRHPGYAGALVFEAFSPLALGSWWAVVPSAVGLLALVARTALEDRALRAELPGYLGYAARTRWRLLPGLW